MKFFSDIIEALGEIFNAGRAFTKLTTEQRTSIKPNLGDTSKALNASLNMLLLRLNEISSVCYDVKFENEIKHLIYMEELINTERQFPLYENLRFALAEWKHPDQKTVNVIRTQNWQQFHDLMYKILQNEGALGDCIAQQFQKARLPAQANAAVQNLRDQIKETVATLNSERVSLIKLELDIYNLI